jgi:hypothetical protein
MVVVLIVMVAAEVRAVVVPEDVHHVQEAAPVGVLGVKVAGHVTIDALAVVMVHAPVVAQPAAMLEMNNLGLIRRPVVHNMALMVNMVLGVEGPQDLHNHQQEPLPLLPTQETSNKMYPGHGKLQTH